MDYYHKSKFFGSLGDWVVALSQKLGLVASHREFVVVALLRAAGVAEALHETCSAIAHVTVL
jgi:hypothetical protein